MCSGRIQVIAYHMCFSSQHLIPLDSSSSPTFFFFIKFYSSFPYHEAQTGRALALPGFFFPPIFFATCHSCITKFWPSPKCDGKLKRNFSSSDPHSKLSLVPLDGRAWDSGQVWPKKKKVHAASLWACIYAGRKIHQVEWKIFMNFITTWTQF